MNHNLLNCITTYYYQIDAILLFFVGLLGVVFSRNLIKILLSIEFMFNAVNLIFVSFSSYIPNNSYLGYTVVIFSTAISALVLAVGLYFTNILNQKFGTIDVNKIYSKYKETNKC